MVTTDPTYMAHELLAQWGWRALDDSNLPFSVKAMELSKIVLLNGVFPRLRERK